MVLRYDEIIRQLAETTMKRKTCAVIHTFSVQRRVLKELGRSDFLVRVTGGDEASKASEQICPFSFSP